MTPGFDFSTAEVLEWELDAIWQALDENRLIFSRHAREELSLDALTLDDVLDAINFPDETSKDLPGGRRADRDGGLADAAGTPGFQASSQGSFHASMISTASSAVST